MRRLNKTLIKISSFLISFAVIAMFILAAKTSHALPDEINVAKEGSAKIASMPHVYLAASASPASSGSASHYTASAKLWGFFPAGQVEVNVVPRQEVLLCGTTFGVKIYSKGLIVVSTAPVICDNKSGSTSICPADNAGIKPGDVITHVDGIEISKIIEFTNAIKNSGGKPVEITFLRNDTKKTVTLIPVLSQAESEYKTGLWVRESASGIGTLTFIDPETGYFGGLGHAICDTDTGKGVPLADGSICNVIVTGVEKGAVGVPGELVGYLGDTVLGKLTQNGVSGVFGQYSATMPEGIMVPVAMKQEVREGKAQMLVTLPGEETALYDILIEKINFDPDAPSRNMVIKVTDKRLLEMTGGIVQGMSGSPIIQDGQFVAAATHVFINDPTRGYAIFSENMVASNHTLIGAAA